MEFTNVLPGVKLVKQDEAGNEEELTQKVKALWQDRERCEKYAENCKTVHFDTLEEYCEKLCGLYKGE